MSKKDACAAAKHKIILTWPKYLCKDTTRTREYSKGDISSQDAGNIMIQSWQGSVTVQE